MTPNDFITSIPNKVYTKIRSSKGDAECRRYLREHLSSYEMCIELNQYNVTHADFENWKVFNE